MRKINLQLLSVGLLTVASLGVAGFSLAVYVDGRMVNNPTNFSELAIDTEFTHKVDVTFSVKCRTKNGFSAYLYDEGKQISTIMSFDNATSTASVTYEVDANKPFNYRYFIASTSDPDTNAVPETGNASNYRTETFTTSNLTATDKWKTRIEFNSYNKDVGMGNSMYIHGTFNNWTQDANYQMENVNATTWTKTMDFEYDGTSYYEFKFVTSSGTYEGGGNRSFDLVGDSGAGNSQGFFTVGGNWQN